MEWGVLGCMRVKYLFGCTVKPDGKLYYKPNQRELLLQYAATFRKPDQEVHLALSIQEVKGKLRTGQQNRFYWLRNSFLGEPLGLDRNQVHELLMQECGLGKNVEIMGKQQFIRDSSTNLDTKEFSMLIERQDAIANWLNEDRAPDHWIRLPQVENVE